MRRRLALLVVSVTAMVSVAALLPLAVVVTVVARDRALAVADEESRTLAGVLAALSDPTDVGSVLEQLNAGNPRSSAVFLADGTRMGAAIELGDTRLAVALGGRAFTVDVDGGRQIVVPVRTRDGSMSVAVVEVPDVLLREGVTGAWVLIASVGIVLSGLGVVLADRLARSMTRASEDLQEVSTRLGGGDLAARVEPSGPPEIAAVGTTINRLADQIDDLVAAEREAVADLSHRLRTPLTALQLEADSVDDEERRARLHARIRRVTAELDAVIRELRRPRDREVDDAVDLVAVVRQRADHWGALAEEQDRDWVLDLPPDPVVVGVREDDLAAAVDALLGNVIAHTPDGSGCQIAVEPGQAILVVADEGPGIPTGADERGTSAGGSTGLGIDIARRTAEAAGGSFEIGRSEHGGARVEARFGTDPPSPPQRPPLRPDRLHG